MYTIPIGRNSRFTYTRTGNTLSEAGESLKKGHGDFEKLL